MSLIKFSSTLNFEKSQLSLNSHSSMVSFYRKVMNKSSTFKNRQFPIKLLPAEANNKRKLGPQRP